MSSTFNATGHSVRSSPRHSCRTFPKTSPKSHFFLKKILKVLKPATSTSALDREHSYSNSFTLCRGRTLYPHDMFRFDASAGPTRVYTIPLMCQQANMTKLLHQPNPRYATRQSAGVSRLRTSDRVSYPDTDELLEFSGGSILSGQLT